MLISQFAAGENRKKNCVKISSEENQLNLAKEKKTVLVVAVVVVVLVD